MTLPPCSSFLQLDKIEDEDIIHVAKVTEKLLQSFIYLLLEKVIELEANEGYLNVSSISPSILQELKVAKAHINDCKNNSGSDLDKWLLHRMINVFEIQIDYVIHKYHHQFHNLTEEFKLNDESAFAYDKFVRICKKLFLSEITWGRIIALLFLSSEIAVSIIKHDKPGVEKFLERVVHYVVEFVVKEEIAQWISNHGGWISVIDFLDSSDCPERAHHILTLMTLSEMTNVNVWLKRVTTVAVVVGVCFSLKKILNF